MSQKMVRRIWRKRSAQNDEVDERKPISYPGNCTSESCSGEDIACKPFPSNHSYTCICTHDSYPPTLDGKCPRMTVEQRPIPIPINIHPHEPSPLRNQNWLFRTKKMGATKYNYLQYENYIVPSIIILLVCTTVTICLGIFLKRKLRRSEDRASPINLKQALLLADRYAPNPQYSACAATGIPLLRKETISFLNEVGEGCFGKVYKGELRLENADQVTIVAVKVLKESATKEAEEDFLREVEIMSAFKHPNILSLLGVILKDGIVNPMMVFEFMPHGALAELLRCQNRLPPDGADLHLGKHDLLMISLQISEGMSYLASQRFVHRDLACRNCLVTEGPVVKIADFGMSRDVYTCDYYKIGGSRLLPVRWMSPESVLYGRFTLESDIWSYGVVLWEIYSYGKQPYYGHTNEQVVKLILDGIMLIPPEDCPPFICELMKICWKTEPRNRITFPVICDKLEAAFNTCTWKSEVRTRLPRPPPLPVFDDTDLLDGEGYLKPKEIVEQHYLETVSE